MRGPGEGCGIGRDLKGRCGWWEGSLMYSMCITQTGVSAENGQEGFLAGFRDAGAVRVSGRAAR